jgi:hypothetical protein
LQRNDDASKQNNAFSANSSSRSSVVAGNEQSSSIINTLSGTVAGLDFTVYPRYTSLITGRETIKPKLRPLSWLMRLIEEIYDNRYAKDTADLKTSSTSTPNSNAPESSGSTPFPTFVVEFFTKRYGLRSLIDQTCWDLLYNVHTLRKENLEVEVFACFLEEFYDPDDLLFYLYVRSILQKELGVSFRTRWSELARAPGQTNEVPTPSSSKPTSSSSGSGPVPLFLSFKECTLISRTVFGSESDPLFRTFLSLVERHMNSGANNGSSVSKRIEVPHFLHLALVEYHETRPSEESEEFNSASSSSGVVGMDATTNGSLYGGGNEAPVGTSSFGNTQPINRKTSPALLEELGDMMHQANQEYLNSLLGGNISASSLPSQVQAQIRSEVQSQLENKVDGILAAVITSVQSNKPIDESNKSYQSLIHEFQSVLSAAAAGQASSAISSFTANVISHEEVKKTIEPLVSLLVSYAASRLQK